MTPPSEAAWQSFKDAVLADKPAYPNHAAFVDATLDGALTIFWRSVAAGVPTVLVLSNGVEYIVEPQPAIWPLRLFDRWRHKPRVRTTLRDGDMSVEGADAHIPRSTSHRIGELVGA